MRIHNDVGNAMVDTWAATHAGKTLRIYTGSVQGTFGTAPAGTVLAEMVLPNPGYAAAAFVSPNYEAAIQGSWQDAVANASGTIGCYAILDGTKVLEDGTAGTAGSDDLVTSLGTVATGAAFTISKHTLRLRTS